MSKTKTIQPNQPICLMTPRAQFKSNWIIIRKTKTGVLFKSIGLIIFRGLNIVLVEILPFAFTAECLAKNNPFTNIEASYHGHASATLKFKSHEATKSHLSAKIAFQARQRAKDQSCAVLLDKNHASVKERNRSMLIENMKLLLLLAKQNIALRGHDESKASLNKGNYRELLEYSATTNNDLKRLINDNLYMSPEIQNEILEILAVQVRDKCLPKAKSYFSIIVDETMDISRVEQLSFCIRFVDDDLNIREHFLGFWELHSTKAEHIFSIIQKIFAEFNLDFKHKLVAQCYDGTNMSGIYNGLCTHIRDVAPKAIYVHCIAHQLNLALEAVCGSFNELRDAVHNVKALFDFIECSGKRHAIFQSIQDDKKKLTLKGLCDTRWCDKYNSFKAAVEAFPFIIKFLEFVNEEDRTAIGSKANGLLHLIKNFSFLFHLLLLADVFQITNILVKGLQEKQIELISSHNQACATIASLCNLKEIKTFKAFLFDVCIIGYENEISIPDGASSKSESRRKRVADLTTSSSSTSNKMVTEIQIKKTDVAVGVKKRLGRPRKNLAEPIQAKTKSSIKIFSIKTGALKATSTDTASTSASTTETASTPTSDLTESESKYYQKYCDILDCFIDCIASKFDNKSAQPLLDINHLLVDSERTVFDLENRFSIYKEDIDFDRLDSELRTWYNEKKNNNLNNLFTVIDYFNLHAPSPLKCRSKPKPGHFDPILKTEYNFFLYVFSSIKTKKKKTYRNFSIWYIFF